MRQAGCDCRVVRPGHADRRGVPRWRDTRRQRGTSLIEALVAFLVLSLGVLALARIQGQLRLGAETARQRSEAVRLAQEDLEHLRAFASIPAAGGLRSYAEVTSTTRHIDAAAGYVSNTAYTLQRVVRTAAPASARDVSVAVSWPDRAGVLQQVILSTLIAASDPALGGALGVVPTGAAPGASAPGPAGP